MDNLLLFLAAQTAAIVFLGWYVYTLNDRTWRAFQREADAMAGVITAFAKAVGGSARRTPDGIQLSLPSSLEEATIPILLKWANKPEVITKIAREVTRLEQEENQDAAEAA